MNGYFHNLNILHQKHGLGFGRIEHMLTVAFVDFYEKLSLIFLSQKAKHVIWKWAIISFISLNNVTWPTCHSKNRHAQSVCLSLTIITTHSWLSHARPCFPVNPLDQTSAAVGVYFNPCWSVLMDKSLTLMGDPIFCQSFRARPDRCNRETPKFSFNIFLWLSGDWF